MIVERPPNCARVYATSIIVAVENQRKLYTCGSSGKLVDVTAETPVKKHDPAVVSQLWEKYKAAQYIYIYKCTDNGTTWRRGEEENMTSESLHNSTKSQTWMRTRTCNEEEEEEVFDVYIY